MAGIVDVDTAVVAMDADSTDDADSADSAVDFTGDTTAISLRFMSRMPNTCIRSWSLI